jgi:hypothetical protein
LIIQFLFWREREKEKEKERRKEGKRECIPHRLRLQQVSREELHHICPEYPTDHKNKQEKNGNKLKVEEKKTIVTTYIIHNTYNNRRMDGW